MIVFQHCAPNVSHLRAPSSVSSPANDAYRTNANHKMPITLNERPK